MSKHHAARLTINTVHHFHDYTLLETLSENRIVTVFRAAKDGVTCRLAVLKTQSLGPTERVRLQQSIKGLINVDIAGILAVRETIEFNGQQGIVYEDFDGVCLKEVLATGALDLGTFWNLAVSLAQGLGHLHDGNRTHMDVRPHNILVNTALDRVKIVSFGIASLLDYEQGALYEQEMIHDILPYMSPEQTGRMNRKLDFRTDMYSLGVTLYEMLTGSPPFTGNDPLEIIHSHLARQPITGSGKESGLPGVLVAILTKLLAKTAEERYQNCFGLLADLQECQRQWRVQGRVEPFAISRQDISVKFNIPQKLFGRDQELTQLLESFERTADGSCSLMLVAGRPGIGKSALINEIHRPILARRGYFIAGKYDQFRRDVPYSSIIQAFHGLAKQLLSETAERLAAWKERILEAVGVNARIVIDLMPAFGHIIGEQPEVPELGAKEARNRFNNVLVDFIRVFSRQNQPLVIFLDDLQWADPASFELLEQLLLRPDNRFLFIIGAYRDNEVGAAHPLQTLIENVRSTGQNLERISLDSLHVEDVNIFIAEFLRCDPVVSFSLANLVHKKTSGNPFFINQFMKTLYDQQHLRFDVQKGWSWDSGAFESLRVTENVVDLLAEKITGLPEKTRQVLQVCAGIGNRFDLEGLATTLEWPLEETLAQITLAMGEGLIGLANNTYEFHHDRIQEAAYSLIPEKQKTALHLKIGRLALTTTPADELPDKLFYIVNHLNTGSALITEQGEKTALAQLNLTAGKKAKASAAYSTAAHLLGMGIELLPAAPWEIEYPLTFALYFESAEAEYICGDLVTSLDRFDTILDLARSKSEKIQVYIKKIVIFTTQGKPADAVQTGIEGARILGLRVPVKPGILPMVVALLRTKTRLGRRRIEKLDQLPLASDPEKEALQHLLWNMGHAAFFVDRNLFAWIMATVARLSVEHGISSGSPHAFIAYGIILGPGMGNYRDAYSLATTSVKLAEKFDDDRLLAPVYFYYGALIRHWTQPARESIELLTDSCRKGISMGDFTHAGYSVINRLTIRLVTGEKLPLILAEAEEYHAFIKRTNYLEIEDIFLVIRQTVLALLGRTKGKTSLSDDTVDEEDFVRAMLSRALQTPIHWYYIFKAELLYLFGEYREASRLLARSAAMLDVSLGHIQIGDHHFFHALVLAALHDHSPATEQKKYRRQLKKCRKALAGLTSTCAANSQHKLLLVDAEIHRINGRYEAGLSLYEKAIEIAADQGFFRDAGIAGGCAARFHLARGRKRLSAFFQRQAGYFFREWGATALTEEYALSSSQYPPGDVLPSPAIQQNGPDGSAAVFDLKALRKSLKAIAEEKIHSRMIEKTIRTAIEFAGAQRGVLLLHREIPDSREHGEFTIEAEGSVDSSEVTILQSIPMEKSSGLCHAVVNYVVRTGESLVIHDARMAQDSLPHLESDGYITANRIRSIFCLPIRAGVEGAVQLIGILYLENNRASHTFSETRNETLEIICMAAAGRLELSRKAATDPLTGLYNRGYFQSMLLQEVRLCLRQKRHLSLIMVDIDHFKKFNDTWGHQAGDLVLQTVAKAIVASCRLSDIVARFGGEEMVIILPETAPDAAMEVAERVRQGVENHLIEQSGNTLRVTASLGVSGLSDRVKDSNGLIKMADMALYKAKDAGRNQVMGDW